MMLPLYEGVMTLGAPAIELLLSRRARRGKEDPKRLCERRGLSKQERPDGTLIWLHASSVGESVAALVLIERLLDADTGRHVLVTTGTVTSARLMAQRLPARAWHQFVPIDRPAWVRRFLDHWRPDLALIMESEFWPTQLHHTHARGIPIVLVNARMSERSFLRWRKAGALAKPLFGSFDLVMATNASQAGRFTALGAHAVRVPGNLKRSAPPLPVDAAALATLGEEIGARPVWLAASTHDGEELSVIEAHRTLRADTPGLLTVIVPRHPDRGPAIANLARHHGLRTARRGTRETVTPETELYIADTLGELGLFFRLADVVFVAGSLVPVGGHNPVEPAHFDCAILFGPLMSKNAEIANEMTERGAAVQITGAPALAPAVASLLSDPDRRGALAGAARQYVADGTGVLQAMIDGITPFLRDQDREPPG